MFSTSFDHSGREPTWYFWATGKRKKLENATLKKGLISGFAQIGFFSDLQHLCFFVHNFHKNHPNRKCLGCSEKFRKQVGLTLG